MSWQTEYNDMQWEQIKECVAEFTEEEYAMFKEISQWDPEKLEKERKKMLKPLETGNLNKTPLALAVRDAIRTGSNRP